MRRREQGRHDEEQAAPRRPELQGGMPWCGWLLGSEIHGLAMSWARRTPDDDVRTNCLL